MRSIPSEEVRNPRRLQLLRDTGLLDSPPEEPFDRLTRMASRVLRAPISLVSLVDEDRQFFKSCIGLPEPWASTRETPLTHSFCQQCVASGAPLIVEDARAHELVRNSLAIQDLGVIAYAGIPLVTSDGARLGSFCVIDSRPRQWTSEEIHLLKDFAAVAVAEIELHALGARARVMHTTLEEARREDLGVIATVAHELRQPINTISVAAPLLRSADATVRERAACVVEKQTHQLQRLVDDLLDIARLERHQISVVLEQIDLREPIADTVETLRPVIGCGDRILTLTLPPTPVPAMVDSGRVVQVLTNLLHNAAKFTDAGDSIAVTLEQSGRDIILRVRDTGRGIPPNLLRLLFQPFTQATPGERGGLGIGLSVAKALVEMHGGTIVARSDGPGLGAEFEVRLPSP